MPQQNFEVLAGNFYNSKEFPKATFWFFQYQTYEYNGAPPYSNFNLAHSQSGPNWKGFDIFLKQQQEKGIIHQQTSWDEVFALWSKRVSQKDDDLPSLEAVTDCWVMTVYSSLPKHKQGLKIKLPKCGKTTYQEFAQMISDQTDWPKEDISMGVLGGDKVDQTGFPKKTFDIGKIPNKSKFWMRLEKKPKFWQQGGSENFKILQPKGNQTNKAQTITTTTTTTEAHYQRVKDIEPESKRLFHLTEYDDYFEKLAQSSLESYSKPSIPLIDFSASHGTYSKQQNQFVVAAHCAFQNHYQFTWTPDLLFLLIAQGVANLVNKDAEKYRQFFVSHKGKEKITVIRDRFIKGSPNNNWEGVFSEFSKGVESKIGPHLYNMFIPEFTTTTNITKAACEIVLMDAVQSYFEFHLFTKCGIPGFKLKGTREDYEKVLINVDSLLTHLGMTKWLDVLKPIMKQFIDFRNEKCDKHFWNSFYKYNSVSGGAYVTGWIQAFFPNNPHCYDWEQGLNFESYSGTEYGKFSSGISSAPFIWHYLGEDYNMEFLAGFIGVIQEESFLEPYIGWAIKYATQEK